MPLMDWKQRLIFQELKLVTVVMVVVPNLEQLLQNALNVMALDNQDSQEEPPLVCLLKLQPVPNVMVKEQLLRIIVLNVVEKELFKEHVGLN